MKRATLNLLLLATGAMLQGCWLPPNANTRPPGPPRVIASGVMVTAAMPTAIVRSIDADTRTITVQFPEHQALQTIRIGPRVANLSRLSVGARLCAAAREELTVYVSSDGQLPGATRSTPPGLLKAKVLATDRSYRLLKLQRPNGSTQTLKVGRDVPLAHMHAGDDVMIEPLEIRSASVCKP